MRLRKFVAALLSLLLLIPAAAFAQGTESPYLFGSYSLTVSV